MKNVNLLSFKELKSDLFVNPTCACINLDAGGIFIATQTTVFYVDVFCDIKYEFDFKLTEYISEYEGIVGIEYVSERQSVCIATNLGQVLMWNILTTNVECLGNIPSGFKTMKWSPDQELITLITAEDSLMLMTSDFDEIKRQEINDHYEGEGKLINVGWGKKETQFHGSEGKQAATNKIKTENIITITDDLTVSLSWKASGEMFATSTINLILNKRQIHIWLRDGNLYAINDNVGCIEQSLAYKPSGNVIATSLHIREKHEIIFFERNGLQHGSFIVRGPTERFVKKLSWNIDSSLLAAQVCGCNENNQIHLYYSTNYTWYLKQVIEGSIADMFWDIEDSLTFHIIFTNGVYKRYQFDWIIYSYNSTCVVIDGDLLKVCDFQQNVIPPPMCSYIIKMKNAINKVSLFDSCLVVFEFNGSITIFSKKSLEFCNGQIEIAIDQGVLTDAYTYCSRTLICPIDIGTICNICMFNETSFACVHYKNGLWVLIIFLIKKDKLVKKSAINLDQEVLCLTSCSNNKLGLEFVNGDIFLLSFDETFLEPLTNDVGTEIKFPEPCQQMSLSCLNNSKISAIGLNRRFKLFINDCQINTNCTSYIINDNFFVFTTHQHLMKFIDRKSDKVIVYERRLERGSTAILSASTTSIVLQMPRGNLECIHPRPLLLINVLKFLSNIQYYNAIVVMRKHRINMNLIYDHDPELFIKNIETFIKQVNSPDLINLFLADLNQQNCISSMYQHMYVFDEKSSVNNMLYEKKVDTICNMLREKMIIIDFDKYLLSILTCFVKKIQPDIENALLLVKKIKNQDKNDKKAEQALKHLIFLVDVNQLYDVALGMYDFNLVLTIAGKSQKDPKEYLPFLKELQEMEENYKCFSINNYLKLYKKALGYLCKCKDKFEECLIFVKQHNLYTDSLEYFSVDSENFQRICYEYGNYLYDKRKYEQSGLIYERGHLYTDSIKAYEKENKWQEALVCAVKAKFSNHETSLLAKKLSENLRKQQKFKEAAVILEDYLKDYECSIEVLIEGRCWQEAMRIIHKYNRLDFMQTHLNDAVLDAYKSMCNSFNDLKIHFQSNFNRLEIVREKRRKAEENLNLYDEFGDDNDLNNCDVYSDTSSVTGTTLSSISSSQRSRTSGKSSKSRKKRIKKIWSLRENSPHEDLALIDALKSIYLESNEYRKDVHDLIWILFTTNRLKETHDIQQQYNDLVVYFLKHIDVIWSVEFLSENRKLNDDENDTDNLQFLREFIRLKIVPELDKEMSWKLKDIIVDVSS